MGVHGPRASIAVLIATRNREAELANRSLRSVMAQTRPPDLLVVVDDSDRRHLEANRRIVCGVVPPPGSSMRVRYLRNDRTPGASGAWNVGLDWLHRQALDVEKLLVAILDDDDEWDPTYLAACAADVELRGLDMVAADIVRHEGDGARLQLAAPDSLRARDFLVRNPGIQGSNLFIRLSTLLAAGLFDEALPSTTDRDLCIRVADLGFVRFGRLARPLVHHHASRDRPRLSTPGSSAKRAGLDGFFRKYRTRMTADERAAFSARAAELFAWSPATEHPEAEPIAPVGGAPRAVSAPIFLVIGMTTASMMSPQLPALLDDLASLMPDSRLSGLDIIILENGPRAPDDGRVLGDVVENLCTKGVGAVLVPIERQTMDAHAGLFGRPFDRGDDRVSIAVARTMLQTYVYLWARRRPGAAAWIIDDDMHLDNLVWRGGHRVERERLDVVGAVWRLRESGVAIAIGNSTEAPPLPFASCVRTQLVDAWHNLALLARLEAETPFPELLPENMALRSRFADYYYDLSRRETDHLETPFWYVPDKPGQTAEQVFEEIVDRLPRVLAGEEVFRPLIHDASIDPLHHIQPSVHRGGNTFVFDLRAFWDFPNTVPRLDGVDTRRSDMVWSLLNRYGAWRSVVKLPVSVRQARTKVEVQRLDLEKLAQDIHGYAVYSALDDLFLERAERRQLDGGGHEPDDFELSDHDLAFAVARFNKYVRERLYAFQLSFYRASGLARALEQFLDERGGGWWLGARHDGVRERLGAAIRLFGAEYDLDRLQEFRRRVLNVDTDMVAAWLGALRDAVRVRRGDTDADEVLAALSWLEEQRGRSAAAVVRGLFGRPQLRVLGQGAEGVALTDETTVYKAFDAGRLDSAQREFLKLQVGRWTGLQTIHTLEELRETGSFAVLTYRYEDACPYVGGHGGSLRRLLDESRTAGITFTNIHPDNLVVTREGRLRVIDYGVDVRPFSEERWDLMARRVYLSGRFPSAPDLRALMRASLTDRKLSELDGFDWFLRSDPDGTKVSLLDRRLEDIVGALAPSSLFDYGCGKGVLAATFARRGISVTAFDPDRTLRRAWQATGAPACFVPVLELPDLLGAVEGRRFDVVLCSLVLCVIDDDLELMRVIGDLARLVDARGHVVVAVCHPDHVSRSTLLQHREPPADPGSKCITWKTIRASGVRRRDVHRPVEVLIRVFGDFGLHLHEREDTPSIDPETLESSSDFLIMTFRSDVRSHS